MDTNDSDRFEYEVESELWWESQDNNLPWQNEMDRLLMDGLDEAERYAEKD